MTCKKNYGSMFVTGIFFMGKNKTEGCGQSPIFQEISPLEHNNRLFNSSKLKMLQKLFLN